MTLHLAFALFASSTPVLAAADTVTPEIVARLDAANASFSRAFVAGDGAAVAAAYTSDAILHPPLGRVITGGDRVARYWRPIRAGTRLGHRIEPTLRRQLAGDVVLEMGRWHDRPLREGEPEPPWVSGCYTVIWHLDADGTWRMAYDSWTAPMEASTACQPAP